MGTTPKGYPYPEDTDLLSQGAQAIKALATAIDTGAGRSATGTASLALPTANTSNAVAVTFPVGRFTASPAVIISRYTGYGANATTYYWPGGMSASGFTINGVSSAVGGTASIGWLAVQAP